MVQAYNLNYNNFSENIWLAHKAVREHEHFTDVILACDDGEINAHNLLLYAGSELFEKMLPRFKNPNPFIYLKGLKHFCSLPVLFLTKLDFWWGG